MGIFAHGYFGGFCSFYMNYKLICQIMDILEIFFFSQMRFDGVNHLLNYFDKAFIIFFLHFQWTFPLKFLKFIYFEFVCMYMIFDHTDVIKLWFL